MASLEERLDRIDEALAGLSRRRAALEAPEPAGSPPPRPEAPAAAARPAVEAPARAPHRQVDLEDLLGGRVLAWVGGAAVLVGVVLFVAYAVRIGWIDEP